MKFIVIIQGNSNQLQFIKPAELAKNVELNLNNFNNINDFNHITDIDPDRNNINLQPNCFNVDPSNLLQIP